MKWDAKNASGLATRRSLASASARPTADRGAVHRGDHRLRELVDREHQLRDVLLEHLHEPDRVRGRARSPAGRRRRPCWRRNRTRVPRR